MKRLLKSTSKGLAYLTYGAIIVGCASIPLLYAAGAPVGATAPTGANPLIPSVLGDVDQVPEGKLQTDISADKMDYDTDKHVLNLDGNVRVFDHQQGVEMTSNKMVVTMNKDNNPVLIEAVDEVKIVKDDKVATSGKAVYDVPNKVITLTDLPIMTQGKNRLTGADSLIFFQDSGRFETKGGRPRLEIQRKADEQSLLPAIPGGGDGMMRHEGPQQQVILANSIIYDSKAHNVNLNGNVQVEDNDVVLTANSMNVVFNDDNKVTNIEALDGVKIVRDTGTATGDKAMYNTVDGTLVLTGNPEVQQPGFRQTGAERVVYRRETGKITVEGGTPRIIAERKASAESLKP